jgi:hypothetical protein
VQKTNVAVTVFFVFTVVASLFTVLASISSKYTIPSTGTLSPARAPPTPSPGYQDNATHQFIIRGPWMGTQKTAADVDAFVTANPYGTGVMLADGSYNILNVISYTRWNASRFWVPDIGDYPGWEITYPQLKAVIDRFHYYGWKVILNSATQIVESPDPYSTYYYTQLHPELIAVNSLGQRYDQVYPGNLRVNFFANYTTADTRFNISVGQRLMDVYNQRLSQMISDGSFLWDGWLGVDGWTGLSNDGMFWVMNNAASYAIYGTNIGTTNPAQWYWGDAQSINEFGNSSYSSLIPAGNFQSAVGTFGKTLKSYTGVLFMDSSHMYANRYQATYTGNITSISVSTGGGSCQVSVYNDSSGAPNALIGYGNGTSLNGGFAAIALTTQAVVTSGSYYWLAVQPSTSLSITYDPSVTSVRSANGTNTYGSFNSTFPTPTYGTYDMDIYATVSQYGNWTSMSTVQESYWIQDNANVEWWQYWQVRFAQMFAGINAVFNQRPSDYKVGTIIATDLSSAISGSGINCPVGMVNMTAFAQYDSFNHCQASDETDFDNETIFEGYAVGLSTYGLSAQVPDIHTIIEVAMDNWGTPLSEANDKQKYLSAAQTYVWVNGTRYRGSDPNWVVLFETSGATADYPIADDLAPWIISVADILTSANPTYLGPVLDIPLVVSVWSTPFYGANYAFAQFAQDLTLNSTGFSQNMTTVFLDATGYTSSTLSASTSTGLLQMFANGSINIIYGGVGTKWSSIFMGNNESSAQSTFKLTANSGSTIQATTLPISQVTDAYGQMILGNTYNTTYSMGRVGIYANATGFIPLIQYNDNRTAMGMYHNGTSGRFLYMNGVTPNAVPVVDKSVVNRGIDWASNDPISVNNSLADAKVFALSSGSIAITMMNLDTYSQLLPITLNLTGLNLPTGTYTATWLSSGSSVVFSDPSNVQITLSGGADVLVISLKHS